LSDEYVHRTLMQRSVFWKIWQCYYAICPVFRALLSPSCLARHSTSYQDVQCCISVPVSQPERLLYVSFRMTKSDHVLQVSSCTSLHFRREHSGQRRLECGGACCIARSLRSSHRHQLAPAATLLSGFDRGSQQILAIQYIVVDVLYWDSLSYTMHSMSRYDYTKERY
jgi:hypothetical protein